MEYRVVANFENYLIYSNGTVYGKKHKKFIKPQPSNKGYMRNRRNNDISNLRWATYTENNINRRLFKSNKSGHRHINYQKTRHNWIYSKQGQVHKTFNTKQEAIIWKFYQLIKLKI